MPDPGYTRPVDLSRTYADQRTTWPYLLTRAVDLILPDEFVASSRSVASTSSIVVSRATQPAGDRVVPSAGNPLAVFFVYFLAHLLLAVDARPLEAPMPDWVAVEWERRVLAATSSTLKAALTLLGPQDTSATRSMLARALGIRRLAEVAAAAGESLGLTWSLAHSSTCRWSPGVMRSGAARGP